MRQWLSKWSVEVTMPIRIRAKSVLDRRYSPRSELGEHIWRTSDAHRLATECSRSLETVLRNEVELWQAIDALEMERTGKPYPRR